MKTFTSFFLQNIFIPALIYGRSNISRLNFSSILWLYKTITSKTILSPKSFSKLYLIVLLCVNVYKLKPKITIRDIAREANCSLATVSRAFTENSSINEKTRQEILRAAGKLNYSPNRAASALRSGKTNIIGVVVPEIDRSFFAKVVKGIEVECHRRGYNIIICQSHESEVREREILQTLQRLQVDGVILSASKETTSTSFFKKLQDEGITITFFDRIMEMADVSSVALNDFNGGNKATNHLIENGMKDIVHLSGDLRLKIFKDRREGYISALRDAGLELKYENIIECGLQVNDISGLLNLVFKNGKKPDAIFASNDYLALAAIQYIQKHSFSVPDDVSVVGFGNSSFTSLVNPSISSIDQQSYQMGLMAAKILLDGKGTNDEFIYHRSILEPKLVVRESSQNTAKS